MSMLTNFINICIVNINLELDSFDLNSTQWTPLHH